jgi:hypothetical protein
MALAIAMAARAQEITATITGTVTDQSGAALPGVTVVARNVGKGVTTEAVTSNTGRYTLPYLINGEYELTFSLTGFKTHVAKSINLHVNDRLEVGASLGVQGVTEAVEVTASSQLIQPSPAVQNLMGSTQVQELPLNNRNFVQLATLVPGVSSSLTDEVGIGLTSTVSLSINGARRNAINWLVDGAQNVDVGSNITLLSTPTLESIEEFKIITSSYAAEWPRSGGGIINVVTKSGSNDFRGSVYEYNRSDSRNANSFFRKQSSDPAIRDNPPYLKYNNYGVTLLRQGNTDGASAEFRTVLTLEPRSVDALVNLALAQKTAGQADLAKETLLRALTIAPRSAAAHYNLAVLCDDTSETARAIDHYRAFLDNAGAEYAGRTPEVRARLAVLSKPRQP